MNVKPILIALLSGLLFSACSMVKSPKATANFKRVKYRANLKLAESNSDKQLTVRSFRLEPTAVEGFDESNSSTDSLAKLPSLSHLPLNESLVKFQNALASKEETQILPFKSTERLLERVAVDLEKLEKIDKSTTKADHYWWEDDPEDWPWKEIILVFILFLLIVTAIYLMISLLGGVVGSLLGLVLLLLLIYLLLDYWQ